MPELDSEIACALDKYKEVVARRVRREIDASCCQTSTDYALARTARKVEETTRDKLEALLIRKGYRD